jgi:hypothetical protein
MNTPGMRWLEQACQVGFAQRNERAQLYAFDMLAGDGEDHRQSPLSLRSLLEMGDRLSAQRKARTTRRKAMPPSVPNVRQVVDDADQK